MSEIKGPGAAGTTKPTASSHEAKTPASDSLKAETIVLTAANTGTHPTFNPNAPTLVLEKPAAGQAVTEVWVVGTQIDVKFDLDAAKITVADGATTFIFADGAVLKVVGLEIGAQGLPETPVTLADGVVIALDDIAPGGQPSPGAGGQPGNQGHSVVDPNPGDVGAGLLDTGALLYTDLHFSVPELLGDTVENILLGEETPALAISIDDVTVTEGNPIEGGEGNSGLFDDPGTTITFTVTLSAPSDTPVTVNYTVVPGSAVPGIQIQDPGGAEGDYNGGAGALAQVGVGTFKIADNASTPSNNFVDGEPSTGFQNGTFTFSQGGTVLLAWGNFNESDDEVASPLLLDNITLNGALLEGFDIDALGAGFATATGFAGFQAGDFDGVTPTQGAGLFVFNPDGTTTSAADVEALLGLPPGTLSQLANDGNPGNGVENATNGSLLFVTLTVAAGDVLSFDFDHIAADGNGPGVTFNDFSFFHSSLAGTLETTNASGIDPLTGTITFAPGETSKTITLNVIDDFLPENTEQFTVVLSDPVGAGIADDTGVGTILDNDQLFLRINDDTTTEGGALGFNLTLSQAAQETIVVQLSSTDGGSPFASTTEGSDYPSLDGQIVTFLPGESQHFVGVTTFDDNIFEPTEAFTLSASVVSGVVDTSDTGQGAILDNDPTPSLTIGNATAIEGNQLVFNLQLSNPSAENIVFEFQTTSGSATEGSDFTSGDGVRVTFLAGETSATVTIDSLEDDLIENVEDFTLSATVVSGTANAADTGEGFIVDDDLSLQISDDTTTEGGALGFNLTLSQASQETIVVQLSSTDGGSPFASTTEGSDYPSLDGQLVTFLPGEVQHFVGVTTFDDNIFEPTEAFTLSASVVSGVVDTSDTGQGVILDNDPTPSLTIGNATAIEGNQLVFNLQLSNPSAENIVFEFQTTSGSATEGSDFTSGDGVRVTFLAGETSATVTIDSLEDDLVEPTEDFTLSATVVSGTAIAADTGEGFITDDDFGPTGGEASATVLEAGVEGAGPDGGGLVFPVGTDPASDSEIATGDLGLSFGNDGPAAQGAFAWSTNVSVIDSDDGNIAIPLTSDGFGVSFVASADGLTLDAIINDGPNAGEVVARLTATPGAGPNASATFNYEQFGNLDHPDEGQSGAADPIRLGFSYTIKDATGDTTAGNLAVTVGDDEPSGTIVKTAVIESGATAFNLAFVLDVSNSMDDTVAGDGTRLELAIEALQNLLGQAQDESVTGPVMIVAFHGAHFFGLTIPAFEAASFASVDDAITGLETFIFNHVLGGQSAPVPSFPFPFGSTFYEGGLDAAADWLKGTSVPGVIHPPLDVNLTDNRVFLLTDGGNNNGNGGFSPNFDNAEDLYNNLGSLLGDIPNLTIRSVGIDIDQAATEAELEGNSDATPAEIAARLALFTHDLDQTDDNLVNGSISLVDNVEGAGAIAGGFGPIGTDADVIGSLLVDDDGVGFKAGADGLAKVATFTILNGAGAGDDETLTIDSDGSIGGVVTRETALGGTIEVNFNSGDFKYTAPGSSDAEGIDAFSYVVLDGDGDPANGLLDITVTPGGSIFSNAGFESDTLRFWSAAGSVWVTDGEGLDSAGIPGQSEGQFFAALHTGNDNALTPADDRHIPTDDELESFLGLPALSLSKLIDTDGDHSLSETDVDAIDGAALKGQFEVQSASGQVEVSFDWQFLTDQSTVAGGSNDIAFVVIEGQLFLLANSDNRPANLEQGNNFNPLATVGDLPGDGLTFDGQHFDNGTSFVENQTLTVADAGNDGLINIAFGVLNGLTSGSLPGSSPASALIVDDVQVVPHVVV